MYFRRNLQILTLVVIILSGSLLSGCVVTRPAGKFISQRYVNTVSYFNTFYNAKKLFDEAVAEAESQRTRQGAQSGTVTLSTQTSDKFNSVIEKCSRLLHQYPSSSHVDNSVLLIGKSYYHMNQNVQAERKFLELLAEFPESPLIPEALLLLGRTQSRMNKNSEALISLSELIGIEEGGRNRNLLAEAHIERGSIHTRTGSPSNAIPEFEAAERHARDRELRARALFNLAHTYKLLDRDEEAFENFEKVIEERPSTRLLFESQIEIVRILTEEEKYDDGILYLHSMLDNPFLAEYNSLIEFEAAEIYHVSGQIEIAVDQYTYVDTTYVRTEVSTKSSFALASIHEEKTGDYQTARRYYEKAMRGTPPSDITRRAAVKNDQLTRYSKHRSEISRLDSIIAHHQSMLAALEQEALSEPDDADTLRENGTSGEVPKAAQGITDPEALRTIISAYEEQFVKNLYELAGLFYVEMGRPDSALTWYGRLARNHPDSPFTPQSLYVLGDLLSADRNRPASGVEGQENERADPYAHRDSVYQKLLQLYPESVYAQQVRRTLGHAVSETETDDGISLYREAESEMVGGNPSGSVALFSALIRDYPSSEYVPRAMFAKGWVYENMLNLPDSAASSYKELISRYPSTQYAQAVKAKVDTWIASNADTIPQPDAEPLETPEQIPAVEEVQDDVPRRGGIPLARPTDRRTVDDIPDTLRTRKNDD